MPSVVRDDRHGARATCEIGEARPEKPEMARHLTICAAPIAATPRAIRPTEDALRRARSGGGRGTRSSRFSRAKGGQSCRSEGTYLSGKGGQERPPNKEKELKTRTAAAAPDLPEKGQSGTAPARSAPPSPLVFARKALLCPRLERPAGAGRAGHARRSCPWPCTAPIGGSGFRPKPRAEGKPRMAGTGATAALSCREGRRQMDAASCGMSWEQGDPCHTLAILTRGLARGGKPPFEPHRRGRRPRKARDDGTPSYSLHGAEKAELRQKAEAAGVRWRPPARGPLAARMPARRKPAPRIDPALVLAVGRIGGNLNQIARWLNRGPCLWPLPPIDAVEVARRLLSVERQLAQLLAQGANADQVLPQTAKGAGRPRRDT